MDLGCANHVRVRKSLLRTRFSVADFGGFFKNRVRKIAYANRVAYAKSSRAGRDLRTRFSICVRDFCWDFTECDLRTLGAICVRDLRTRFAYATRFCVRDLRTRRDFSRQRESRTQTGFAYAKRRTTSPPKSRTRDFLNAMPETPPVHVRERCTH